jgi:hypothetical protein
MASMDSACLCDFALSHCHQLWTGDSMIVHTWLVVLKYIHYLVEIMIVVNLMTPLLNLRYLSLVFV